MTGIDALSHYSWRWRRSRRQFAAIDNVSTFRRTTGQPPSGTVAGVGWYIAQRSAANGGARFRRDAVHGYAVIDDGISIHRVIINDGGVVVDPRHFAARKSVMAEIATAEIAERYEGEMIGTQAKVERKAHAGAAISPTTMIKHCQPGQWRPAARIARHSPAYPGGTPHAIGRPDPATTRVIFPAPVMERSPTPGIRGGPVPTTV
jgi:hypothetical protein